MIVELSAFVFWLAAAAALGHRRDGYGFSILAGGTLFGLLIEIAFLELAGGYSYGDFMLMMHGAPLWVAAGWGVIILACVTTADGLELRSWAKPIAAALMAVSLDFTLDPLAEAAGWWHWKRRDPGFFGVSYDNFIGWLMIVGVFAAVVLHFRKWWAAALGIPVSIAVIGIATLGLERLYPIYGEGLVFYIVHTAAVVAVIVGSERRPWHELAVPVYFHALFAVLLINAETPLMAPELWGAMAMASSCSALWWATGRAGRPWNPEGSDEG